MKMPLKSKFIIYVIFAIILVFLPRGFTRVSETKAMAIITALGIDETDDKKIEVSAQVIIPKSQGGTMKNLMAVSSKNDDITSALEDLSTYLGKNIGIEHCDALILGEDISYSGVENVLDYFFRGNRIDHNTLIIYFNGKARDLIESTSKIDNDFALSIDEITKFSGEYFSSLETTLEQFYLEHYSNNKITMTGGLKINSNGYGLLLEDKNQQESSGKKYLTNDGEIAVYKDWKKVKVLDSEEAVKMNWFIKDAKKGSMKVENINDNIYNGGDVVYSITNKNVRLSTDIKHNIPIVKVSIDVDLRIENIINGDKEKLKSIDNLLLTPMLRAKTIGKIIEDCNEIIQLLKNEKLDILRLYDRFEKFNYTKLEKFLENHTIDEFYSSLIPDIEVKIHQKI